jgi:type IV pilus assembly protein PilY1
MKTGTGIRAVVLLGLIGIGIIMTMAQPASVTSSMTDYCSTPPFLSNAISPNILIVLDNSGSMHDQAYASSYDPNQYARQQYYGYFDPAKMYLYNNNGRWEVTTAGSHTATAAHPIASGDFLNWASMRKIDLAKKLLTGGKAAPRSPEGSVTVKLFGEDSPTGNQPNGWDFTKDFDNSSAPGLLYPFSGNHHYRMTGDRLYISPFNPGADTFTARPNGGVSVHSSWNVTGASSAWEAVDEETDDGDGNTSFMQNTTSREPALFDYLYSGGSSGVISSIKVYAVAKKSSSSTMRVQGVLRVNGSDYPESFSGLSTAYREYSWTWDVNPATGFAWQWSDLKSGGAFNLEGFGIKAHTQPTSNNYPRITQVYMVISTSTPSGGPYSIIVDQGMTRAEGIIDRLSSRVRFGLAFYQKGNGIESGEANGRRDGGYVANYVDFGSPANMITSIHTMSPDTWTPLSETLYEMVRYFRQDEPYYDNSPVDYQTGQTYDPYYYRYSNMGVSNLPNQYVPCAKTFILMLTDGESTMDQNIPAALRDYDHDSRDPGSYNDRGTDYLDDVALWARTADHRTDLSGKQNIYVYSVFMFGRGSQLLKDASVNGGFNDLNGDGKPGPALREYLRDSNEDGSLSAGDLPITYYEGDDGYALQDAITRAIADILKRAASGTAVSVLTTSSKGVGSLVQAYFLPVMQQGLREVTWTGFLQNMWLDSQDNLREDTTNDSQLILSEDEVIRLFFDTADNETKAATFTTDVSGKGGTASTCSPQVKKFSDVRYLWEAGQKLALTEPSERTIFTSRKVIRGNVTTHAFANTPYPEFTRDALLVNSALRDALDPDATYSAENIIRYIRGECLETGVAGDADCGSAPVTTYRDRRAAINGGGADGNVWKLGDIVNSTPKVFAGTPLNTYHIDYSDRTYYDYLLTDAYKHKSSVAFVGANDGMLHAFRTGYLKDTGLVATIKALFKNFFGAGDGDHDTLGNEMWAYIPFNSFPYLKYLADPNYCHIYYNDLSVRLVDASIGGAPGAARTKNDWRTLLIGGMRLGGACSGPDAQPSGPPTGNVGFSSYFAIDVTDPENPVPLWEFSDADMGYSTTFPSVIRTGDRADNGHWYVALGSGTKALPKSGTDIARSTQGYIYLLDLETGALVQKIGLGFNAIVGDILAIDADKDYYGEKIYFGTAYHSAGWSGKLMSISIPNQDLSGWTPSPSEINTLFVSGYPFTSSPDAARDTSGDVWVYAGSGKYYSDLDKIDTAQQIFFGLKDANTTVAEGALYNATNVPTTGTVTQTAKVCAYDSSTGSFGLQDVVTGINPSSPSPNVGASGWKIYLANGERVLSRPLAVGGIVDFLTYKPDAEICKFGGNSYLYAVGYTTGLAPSGVAILAPEAVTTSGGGGGDGTVTVEKRILLGPGVPPTGEAIIVPPPDTDGGGDKLKKKIQVSTGVIVEAENQPVFSVVSKIIHWLKK